MTEAKPPEGKAPEIESVIELIDVIDWRYVALALALGLVAGAVFVYLFVEVPSGDRNA